MTWPAVLAWALIFVGLLRRSPVFLFYLFFAFGAIGTLNMLGAQGGFNLLPQSCCGVFLVGKSLLARGQLARAMTLAIDPKALGLLFLFTLYSLFTAYMMPRLFYHMVEVFDLSLGVAPWPVRLEPTTQNITQSVYLTLSFTIVLIFALGCRQASFKLHYLNGMLVFGFFLILTGLADLALSAAGLADLLTPFRSATYSLLTDDAVMGSKRVVGLMAEASAYGPPCVMTAATLTFLRPCYENPLWRNLFVPLVIAGLVAMAALSTSSTAYAGLIVFAAAFGANWLRRSTNPLAPHREGLNAEAVGAAFAVCALFATIALSPHALDNVYDMVDNILLKKSESASYIERNWWTTTAINALFATNGLGVGLGAARTSNWFACILSNTGIIGAALLAGFILRLLYQPSRSPDPQTREFLTALKFSLLPWIPMAWGAGTTPDYGASVAVILGMMVGLTTTGGIYSMPSATRRASPIRARSPLRST